MVLGEMGITRWCKAKMWGGYEQSRFGCRRVDKIGAGSEKEVWMPMMSEIGGVFEDLASYVCLFVFFFFLNKYICCLGFKTKSNVVLYFLNS